MTNFTTVVGVDARHIEELRIVWPTWKAFRPRILRQPLLLICDGNISARSWQDRLSFVDHPDRRIECWSLPGAGQREKMLSALVFATVEHVRTPWYLKLDTDAVAVAPGRWLQDAWFSADADGRRPAFVTNPWGYTKPADAIDRLDRWGDGVRGLREFPPLRLHPTPGADSINHRRIISWCFFGDTAWTREMASACGGRLPVPSQDTWVWYCAKRRGDFYRTVRMSAFGWRHIHRKSDLRRHALLGLSAVQGVDRTS